MKKMFEDQTTLLEVFRDDEEDCYGICTKVNRLYSLPLLDLVKILIELNNATDEVLQIMKERIVDG